MKQTDGYLLETIAGVPYLLPYGQNIADLKRGVQLNDTGVFLWNSLAQEIAPETLLHNFCSYFEGSPEDLPFFKEDMETFLSVLNAHGMITGYAAPVQQEPLCKVLRIGELYVALHGKKTLFSDKFDAFESGLPADRQPDLTIQIHDHFPLSKKNGTLLLRNQDLYVIDAGDSYTLLFPSMVDVYEGHLTKDGTQADIYCSPFRNEQLVEDLFHALRLFYLYRAQKSGIFALHSASIYYREKAWLFSGPSGTGKSTHTNLWHKLYDTPLINGDLNLLSFKDGTPVVYGLPWCGTSEIFDIKTYPLGGIVLLQQAPENHIESLELHEKSLLVSQRLISPSWTKEQLHTNLHFTENLSSEIYVARLCCNMRNAAAATMKEAIDDYLKGTATC